MRYWLSVLFLLAVVCGCGPKVSKEDLGTVVFDNPKVAGSEKPYRLPEASESASDKEEADKPAHDSGSSEDKAPAAK